MVDKWVKFMSYNVKDDPTLGITIPAVLDW